jgi:hypothetical protein
MPASLSPTTLGEHETTIQQSNDSGRTRQASPSLLATRDMIQGDGPSATARDASIEAIEGLPHELLAAIFTFYRSTGGRIQTLLLVSKLWNYICIEHKALWNTLELSLLAVRPRSRPEGPTRDLYRDYRSHVARFLEMSGPTVPLHIHVDGALVAPGQQEEFVAAFQDLVGPNGCNIGQWKSLKLHEYSHSLHLLLVHPTPILESVMMTYPWSVSQHIPLKQILPDAPRLQHLHLGHFDGELALPPSFLRVRSLVIDALARQAYNVLRQLHQHKHFLVSLEYVAQSWIHTPLPLIHGLEMLDFPSLRRLKLDAHSADGLLATLELPALEELTLAIESIGSRPIRSYAASPNLCRVKKLTIHGGLRNGMSEFKELLRSMPALESLQMYAMEGVERVLEESVELIPNLKQCKLGWKSLGWIVHSARFSRRMGRSVGQV